MSRRCRELYRGAPGSKKPRYRVVLAGSPGDAMSLFPRVRSLVLGALIAVSLPASAGEAVTEFTLRDVDGKQVKLSDYKGKVVLLSFWATWCGPCKVEMQHLDHFQRDLRAEGFEVLSISSDDARTASQAKRYVKQKGFDFTVLLDTDATVTGTYNPNKTLPYGVLIGRDHTIAKVYSGYNPGDEVRLLADVKAELAEAK
jgi:peroxiredoxin